jgi:hypothetical protein
MREIVTIDPDSSPRIHPQAAQMSLSGFESIA